MNLTIVFTVLGQHELATTAIRHALKNITDPLTNIIVVDNGGDYAFPDPDPRVSVERRIEDMKVVNMGVYPVFEYVMDYLGDSAGDIVAFFHSDLMIVEKGFDSRILAEFDSREDLGLIGFVGSNEIDFNGGRGGGTTSNFQGETYVLNDFDDHTLMHWTGSPAEAHGKRNAGFTNAAVVDGCAMVITREAWKRIDYRKDFPPHHFYDRLISTQILEAGLKVGVLGIACDHISGQTVSREERYGDLAKEYCQKHGIAMTHNYDDAIYRKAEELWLFEYRQQKHIVPIKVNP